MDQFLLIAANYWLRFCSELSCKCHRRPLVVQTLVLLSECSAGLEIVPLPVWLLHLLQLHLHGNSHCSVLVMVLTLI